MGVRWGRGGHVCQITPMGSAYLDFFLYLLVTIPHVPRLGASNFFLGLGFAHSIFHRGVSLGGGVSLGRGVSLGGGVTLGGGLARNTVFRLAGTLGRRRHLWLRLGWWLVIFGFVFLPVAMADKIVRRALFYFQGRWQIRRTSDTQTKMGWRERERETGMNTTCHDQTMFKGCRN